MNKHSQVDVEDPSLRNLQPGERVPGDFRSCFLSSLLSDTTEDDDPNFVNFIVDYLVSPSDKAGGDDEQATSRRNVDIEQVIQHYFKLNPKFREHLVEMLRQLSEEAAAEDDGAENEHRDDAIEEQLVDEAGVSGSSAASSATGSTPLDSLDVDDKRRAAQHVAYVRVVGATAKALQLLQMADRSVDGVSLLTALPKYSAEDDSDWDELSIAEGDLDDLLLRSSAGGEAAGTSSSVTDSAQQKKKRRKRKKNKKPMVITTQTMAADDEEDDSLFDSPEVRLVCEQLEAAAAADGAAGSAGSSTFPSGSTLDIKSDALLDKEFKLRCANQPDTKVATWDELKVLIAEVFPHDSELKKAFESNSHDSFDLWRFIVKYGKMYKDFVSEVLEMVNELKKGLHEAMEMHREKTKEILEQHKKEMCNVAEKARTAECRIDALAQNVEYYQQLTDDQKVTILSQEEELDKLKKENSAKDKKLKELENSMKSLKVKRNKNNDDLQKLTDEATEMRQQLEASRNENERLRSKLRAATESNEELGYKLRESEFQRGDEQTMMEALAGENSQLNNKVDELTKKLKALTEELESRQKATTAIAPAKVASASSTSSFSSQDELASSGSSYCVLNEPSSHERNTPFSTVSSAVGSPKGSPIPPPPGLPPPTAPEAQQTSLAASLQSLVQSWSPVQRWQGPYDTFSPGEVFDSRPSVDPPSVNSQGGFGSSLPAFSRTIRKADPKRLDLPESPPTLPTAPRIINDDLSDPWTPARFAGFPVSTVPPTNQSSGAPSLPSISNFYNPLQPSANLYGCLPRALGVGDRPGPPGLAAPASTVLPACPPVSAGRPAANPTTIGPPKRHGGRSSARRSLDFSNIGGGS